MTERIDEKDLPLIDAAPTDELRAVRAGKSVRVPIGSLPASAAVQQQIDALINGQQAGAIYMQSWASLSSVAGTFDGQGAFVAGDSGTHADPVSSATVSNDGQYRWTGSAWQWLRADVLADKADQTYVDAVIAAESTARKEAVDSATLRDDSLVPLISADGKVVLWIKDGKLNFKTLSDDVLEYLNGALRFTAEIDARIGSIATLRDDSLVPLISADGKVVLWSQDGALGFGRLTADTIARLQPHFGGDTTALASRVDGVEERVSVIESAVDGDYSGLVDGALADATATATNLALLAAKSDAAAIVSQARTDTAGLLSTLQSDNDTILAGLGYLAPVAYVGGLSITSARQTVEYDGSVYAALPSAVPFTTSGTFESASFRLIAGVMSADLPVLTGGYQNCVFVRSYMPTAGTPAQNRAAIIAAIAAAVAQGRSACFNGVFCEIDEEIQISSAVRLWARSPKDCHITQLGALNGQGVFRVSASDVEIDGFTLIGDVPITDEKVDLTGWTGDIHHVSAIKIDKGVSAPKVRNIKGAGWFIVVVGFPYDIGDETTALPADYEFIDGAVIEDIEVDYVWAAVRMSGLNNPSFARVRGRYMYSTGHVRSGAPPHLFYLSQAAEGVYSTNVRIKDCSSIGGRGGSAFSLRHIKGLEIDGISIHDTDGLIDMIDNHGVSVRNWGGTDSTYPADNVPNGNRGTVSLTDCSGVRFMPGNIDAAADFDHGRLLYVSGCEEVEIDQISGSLDLVTPQTFSGLGGAYLTGKSVRLKNPRFRSLGATVGVGFIHANNTPDSTCEVIDPQLSGAWIAGARYTPTTAKAVLVYDPDRISATQQTIAIDSATSLAGAPTLKNTKFGYPPAADPRVIGWHFGEGMGNSGVIRTRWPSGHVSSVATDAWISAGAGALASNNAQTGLLCADFLTANVEVCASVKFNAGAVGLAARVTDTSNFIAMDITASTVRIRKRAAGTYTTLASAALPYSASGVYRKLRLVVSGNVLVGYVDEQMLVSYVLTGDEIAAFGATTSHGIFSDAGGASSVWRDILVKSI